ncbi:hypothetical protein [Merismopedia glauca]|uniref:Uncharacterized protein n=1 Tax=Merismopedia glauca CCAP 1448/3 TaxID=1296344 RepID=A0A2T1C357_9CYAN|nr:hypothetical protein [Merismopedia glauca]PSB02553.1 hypothetical protein C7B64_12545 [Merismopedia glauca CCAP 1448/3]
MPSLKPEKIDISGEYPCPCGRKGLLVPITLTEAFGCDRCHQIFAVEEDGYGIEQLSSHYPSKRCWRWIGDRWHITRTKTDSLPLLLVISTAVIIIGFSMVLSSSGIMNVLLWGIVLLVILVLVKVAWLVWRR